MPAYFLVLPTLPDGCGWAHPTDFSIAKMKAALGKSRNIRFMSDQNNREPFIIKALEISRISTEVRLSRFP